MKKKFNVHYYNHPHGKPKQWSHKYTEEWEFLIKIFCPNCGAKGVWASNGYDYYVENEHICTECSTSFYLPLLNDIADDQGLQRLKNLKT